MGIKFIAVFVAMFVTLLLVATVSAEITVEKVNNGNSGAIWTTKGDCGTSQQDVNQYNIGETVYINGAGFNPEEYVWDITGQPGGASCDPQIAVANGTRVVNESGAFCFDAYTVQQGDCGVYKATVGNKHDNYNVIPEFGLIAGLVTILGAVATFFYIRRK